MRDRLIPVVAIPARDEEGLIGRVIAALGRQTALDQLRDPLDLVLVLNNTTDGSLDAAQAAAREFPQLRLTVDDLVFPQDRAHVGSARRHAMNLALGLQPAGVILTTDADAVPSDTWIDANLRAISAGADIVGGRIVGDPVEEARLGDGFLRRAALHGRYAELCDELAALIDPLPYDPWPRHHDHTGGSLAVRSDVYREVGGMDAVPYREDIAFVAKVRAAGFRLAHPRDVMVTVSARTLGRAEGGMADCISAWLRAEADSIPVLFESPVAIEKRLRRRRALRDLGGLPASAAQRRLEALGIGREVFDTDPRSIAALIERHASDDLDAPATVPAQAAIAALVERIAWYQGRSYAA